MITLDVATYTVTQQLDLRTIKIKEWPQEVRRLITPRYLAIAKRDLFPKELLAAEVERAFNLSLEDL
jgi:hypothetical protein